MLQESVAPLVERLEKAGMQYTHSMSRLLSIRFMSR